MFDTNKKSKKQKVLSSYQCTCLWFPGIIFGSQLAVPMSLDIRRNSYTRLLFQEIFVSKFY